MFLFAVDRNENALLYYLIVGVRLFLLAAWFFLCCLIGCIIALFQWKSPDIPRIICSFYSPVSAYLAGCTVKKIDWHHTKFDGSAVVIANHQTFLDLSFFGVFLPPRTVCVAKKSLKYVPLFGLFWYMSGNIFVDRKRREKAIQSLDTATERLRSGECNVWMFPEGTRNQIDPENLLPFKKGAFHLAIQSGVPILPIVCSTQTAAYDNKLGYWRGGEITVKALPPIPTKGKTIEDVDSLIAHAETVMQLALDEVNGKTPSSKNRSASAPVKSVKSSSSSTSSSTSSTSSSSQGNKAKQATPKSSQSPSTSSSSPAKKQALSSKAKK